LYETAVLNDSEEATDASKSRENLRTEAMGRCGNRTNG